MHAFLEPEYACNSGSKNTSRWVIVVTLFIESFIHDMIRNMTSIISCNSQAFA